MVDRERKEIYKKESKVNRDELFSQWRIIEMQVDHKISTYDSFVIGFTSGFLKSEKDSGIREKLILDALRPLVPNLDDIIAEALTEKN